MSDTTELAPAGSPAENYDASNIRVLEGLEAVRKRPGMYIGDTEDGSGLHHMAFEIIDNAVDEALAGHCDDITVTINPGNSVTVTDNGRGIPVDMHAKGRPAIEVILTSLHSGGKFDQNSYKVSGGLHGVGAAAVNALSSRMEVVVARDGYRHFIAFADGNVAEPLRVLGPYEGRSGTAVTFTPSLEIFPKIEFTADRLISRIRQLAFLNSGIRFRFQDTRHPGSDPVIFFYKGGIGEMLSHIDRTKTVIIDKPIYSIGEKTVELTRTALNEQGEEITVPDRSPTITAEVAFEWNDSSAPGQITAFTNNIPQRDGGSHVTGFKTALTRVFGAYATANLPKKYKGLELEGEDYLCGLTAVVSVKLPDPRFSSQTKDKLTSGEVTGVVASVTGDILRSWLDENPARAMVLVEKAAGNAEMRKRISQLREVTRKSAMDVLSTLPGKLTDCSEKDPKLCELFIVEGDSAGGSAKGGRDRKTQAVLPIKGKILNVERVRPDKVLESKEIATIVDALGVRGLDGHADWDRLRYHKVIIMTDADVDGSHICTLLGTLFFRKLPELITRGHLYIAQAPLYSIEKHRAKGKLLWIRDEKVMQEHLLTAGSDGNRVVCVDGSVIEGADLLALGRKCISFHELINSVDEDIGLLPLTECLVVSGALHPDVFTDDGFMQQAVDYVCSLMGGPIGSGARLPATIWSGTVDEEGMQFSWIRKGVVKRVTVRRSVGAGTALHDLMRNFDELERLFVGGLTFCYGSKEKVVFSPGALFDAISERGKDGTEVKRYKGLGEMNADQLWETTLDPTRRSMLQVRIEDITGADEITSICMGEKVPPRRELIESNALLAHVDDHAG